MSEEVTVVEAAGEPSVGLAFADIENAVKIIDYACDQGAFKGWQIIQQVFDVRARLNGFVEAARAQQEEASAASEGEVAADTPTA
jgi:hypothetical protein